jgi:molybdate-binding protein
MGWVAAEYGLKMIEVGTQSSELWYRQDQISSRMIDALGETLASSGFRRELDSVVGYQAAIA